MTKQRRVATAAAPTATPLQRFGLANAPAAWYRLRPVLDNAGR